MDTEKCRVLLTVLHERSLSAAAEALGYTPSGISRLVDSLERGGFVARRTDGRRDLVEVTDRGREVSGVWQARCRQMEDVLLRDFTPEERERFADYLVRAYQNIHRKREEAHA